MTIKPHNFADLGIPIPLETLIGHRELLLLTYLEEMAII